MSMPEPPPRIALVGRRTSHFTRVAMIFAHELGVPFDLEPVHDLQSLDPAAYGGNPALKVPSLRVGSSTVLGTENVCRRLVELAGRAGDPRIVLAEHVTSDIGRSAQELTWHAMSAQVQLVVGTLLGDLPPEHLYFRKIRAGLEGSLAWLETNLPRAFSELPASREPSLLEVTVFCLVEHLMFRRTLPAGPPSRLRELTAEVAARASALATPYG